MKKKLITLILCGVIGGTSIAGLSMYKMSQGTDETQTLVSAKEKEEVRAEAKENIEEKDIAELEGEALKDKNGQPDTNGEVSLNNNSLQAADKRAIKDGQGSVTSSDIINNDSVSNGGQDNTTNNGSNNTTSDSNQNVGSSNGVTTPPPAQESGSFYGQIEQLIFNRVNEERAKAGVPALSYNSTMETYARIKSKDMGVRNYFDHADPNGEMITAQMARDGVSYNAWGENIAYIGGESDAAALADQFMTNWMNSDGHRANILSTNFTGIGVGVYKSGNRYYATQEFYK